MSAQGNLIFLKRSTMKISQIELARQLGFSAQFLGVVESGRAAFPVREIKNLCKILELDPEVFCKAATKDFSKRLRERAGIK